jgi:dTDP-4-dehydrorhamnose reductase
VVAFDKEMKWLVLGGNGQLGRVFSTELKKSNLKFVSLSHAQLDITNKKDLKKCFLKEIPTVVINAAAWTNVDLAESEEDKALLINAFGPRLIAEECANIGAKFVHLSTDYVFSGNSNTPWSEDAVVAPVSAYGRTKAIGEQYVLHAHPSGSFVVRTAWLYSPWGNNFVKTILKLALSETKNIEVVNDQIGQPTSASDLVQYILSMISKDVTPGIYHATNSGQTSWFDLAVKIFELSNMDCERIVAVNSTQFPRPAMRPKFSVLSNQSSLREGLTPMQSWQDALTHAFPSILKTIN